MISEIKTTAQFSKVAGILLNENINQLKVDMPSFYKEILTGKKMMRKYIDIVMDQAKIYFYEGHDEKSGYFLFRNVDQAETRAYLQSLLNAHKAV